jgi:hypothetical protein
MATTTITEFRTISLCRCGEVGATYVVSNNGHVHFDVCAVCAQECVTTHP